MKSSSRANDERPLRKPSEDSNAHGEEVVTNLAKNRFLQKRKETLVDA